MTTARQPSSGHAQEYACNRYGWQGLPCWRILDTDFGDGQAFLEAWQAWLDDAKRSQVLHYVALCPSPPALEILLATCSGNASALAQVQELKTQWFGFLPGFHRLLLADGKVILTLCVGDAMKSLQQQQFHADVIAFSLTDRPLAEGFDSTSLWSIKALAHCARRGTILSVAVAQSQGLAELHNNLKQCGFVISEKQISPGNNDITLLEASFAPSWELKHTRSVASKALPVQRCAVIGAGLAGASVAASLARRGWKVSVLDAAPQPAAGASGLPVGLVVPHVSSDDCALSRLSRAGVRLMLQQARQLLQEGLDWAPTGVLEREIAGTPQLPNNWAPEGQEWSTRTENEHIPWLNEPIGRSVWHKQGAWLKPAELIKKWLTHSCVQFHGNAKVSGLQRRGAAWDLLADDGSVLCSAERVVFANASGAWKLLEKIRQIDLCLDERLRQLPPMQGMRGLLCWSTHASSTTTNSHFPPHPVNGAGSVIPRIPTECGSSWFIGSSYQPEQQPERSDWANHQRNFEHLQKLQPNLANQLQPAFSNDSLSAWKNTRCVTVDRLPVVGALDGDVEPSLWICAGLGSRGMSFSVLCAEVLAARMGAEPLPIEKSLAKSLVALRA